MTRTESLCPVCLSILPASIIQRRGAVYLQKSCPEHGFFEELYWSSSEQYARAAAYGDRETRQASPESKQERCPIDCGTCSSHRSSTVLAIIDVTNQCNLRCPICFAHAGASGYLYEPTAGEISDMLKRLRSLHSPPSGLQFSGGEPTVREDLPELIREAREVGFPHIEVNSNGVRMAGSQRYCHELKQAGLNTVYLQFDGVTSNPYLATRGVNLFPLKERAIRNLGAAGLSVVLVPTLVGGVNDHEVGSIIDYAVSHRDVVRGVNFQPVAIMGRVDASRRREMRVTLPDLMRLAEEQTGGIIKQGDWYPAPASLPFTRLLAELKGEPLTELSSHPHCGVATYLVFDGDSPKPITKYLNVERLLEAAPRITSKLRSGAKTEAEVEAALSLVQNVKLGSFKRHLVKLIEEGSFEALSGLHKSILMVSGMHFMDAYNFDAERVRRCIINYATPDGERIPFCAMNLLHRSRVEKKHAKALYSGRAVPPVDVEALTKKLESS